MLEDNEVTNRVLDSTEYNEAVTTKCSKTIDTFSSRSIHAQMKTAFTGVRLNVIAHTLHADEGLLPQGLIIQNAHTEMCNSSKNVAIIVRNSTAYPQTLKKKFPVVRVVVANWVPEPQVQPCMINMLDDVQGIQTQKLTTEQRQENLFEKLDLSSLESCLQELVDSTCLLLAEYHNIFPLEPCELSCNHLTEHVIKVTDDTPFKE